MSVHCVLWKALSQLWYLDDISENCWHIYQHWFETFFSFNFITGRNSDPTFCNPFGVGHCGQQIGSCNGDVVGVHLRLQTCKAGRKRMCYISATARPMDIDEGSTMQADAKNLVEADVGWFDRFSRFSRPHTIIGSVSSIDKTWPMNSIVVACSLYVLHMLLFLKNFHIIWQAASSRRVTSIELFAWLFYLVPLDIPMPCKISLGIIYSFSPKFTIFIKITGK